MFDQETFDRFTAVNNSAQVISDQNERFMAAAEIDDPDFSELAKTGVAEEQRDHLELLGKLVVELPYESLHDELALTEGQLESAKHRLANITDEEDSERTRWVELAAKVADLAPSKAEAARELATEKIASISLLNRRGLEKKIEKLSASVGRLTAAFAEMGEAWPVPLAAAFLKQREVVEQQIILEDEIPLNPRIHDNPSDKHRRIIDKHIDAPGASLYSALLLADNAGKPNPSDRITTVDDIIECLYDPKVIAGMAEHELRSRVTTILGPKEGWRIKKILGEEGLALQYGWRRRVEVMPDGRRKELSRRRIYRAIPTVEAGSEPEEFVEEVVVAEPRPTNPSEATNYTEAARSSADDSELLDGGNDDHLGEHHRMQLFAKDVKAAIVDLQKDGLMCEQPLATDVILEKSRRSLLGTDAAVSRLLAMGVITRDTRDSGKLSPTQLVTMVLIDAHKHVFAEPRHRRQAMRIIEKRVASFFKEQRRNVVKTS